MRHVKEIFMPLLTPKQKTKKTTLRISLDQSILEEIEAYYTWAGFGKLDEFLEQAAEHTMSKDKEMLY